MDRPLFQKISDLKDLLTKKEVLIVGGVLVIAAGGYYAYQWYTHDEKKDGGAQGHLAPLQGTRPEAPKTTFNFERASTRFLSAKDRVEQFKTKSPLRFEELAAAIAGDAEGLTEQTLIKISQLVLAISEIDFSKIVKTNRKARRQVLNGDNAKFELVCIDGIKEYESLYAENLAEVLASLKITQDKFEQAIGLHAQTNPAVHLTGRRIYDAMLERMPTFVGPEGSTQELIVKMSTYLLDTYKRQAFKPVTKEYARDVALTMVYDLMENEFKIEEEDFRSLLEVFDTDEAKAKRDELNRELQLLIV